MENNYKVYLHIFPNKKLYVGITKLSLYNRWRDGKGYKSQYINRAIKKYGWENIKHLILFEKISKEMATKIEINLIKKFKSNNKKYGYNIENGGQLGALGIKRSKKTLIKMSNANKGKVMSLETRKKISESSKGRIVTDDMKRKMSEKQLGIKNHNYGKKASIETRLKMSLNQKKGSENKNSVKVSQYDLNNNLIKVWDCMADITKEYNVSHSCISACCNGKQKTSKGYIWKYFL